MIRITFGPPGLVSRPLAVVRRGVGSQPDVSPIPPFVRMPSGMNRT